VEVKPPTKWAPAQEIAAAEHAWPRSVSDAIHVASIQKETGLSAATAKLALDLGRGDREGDEIVVDERL